MHFKQQAQDIMLWSIIARRETLKGQTVLVFVALGRGESYVADQSLEEKEEGGGE